MDEHGRDPAALAARAEGDVDPALLGSVVDGERRLVDLLEPDEQPHHLLTGTMFDTVRGEGEEASRSRRSAPPDGGVYALFTDRRLLVVVSYGDSASTEAVALADVEGATLRTLGADRRLRLDAGEIAYDLYPEDGAACEAAASYVEQHGGGGDSGDGERDPLERLERLADLHERGALTDEEFAAKKSELLEDV